MTEVSVSVVMGVFNGADALVDTLDSVLAQSLLEFELIIVNDGSTDTRIATILEAYTHRDERVRVINKANQGLTCALIDGCNAANGAYIARIDVGDVMLPSRLELQAQVLDAHADCHLVTSQVSFHGPGWEPLGNNEGAPASGEPVTIVQSQPDSGLAGDVPHHGSVMFRRCAYIEVGGYRPEFYYGQDWDLWYRLAEVGLFYVVPEVLYKARYFPGAISMASSERQRNIAACSLQAHGLRKQHLDDKPALLKASVIRPDKKSAEATSVALAQGNYFIGEALRRSGDVRCRQYLWKSVRLAPLSPRGWVRLVQSIGLG